MTSSLFERIKNYSFPGGEDAARRVRGLRSTQAGQLRSAVDARWVQFTAEEHVDATKSGFAWNARMGTGLLAVQVTDAYENGAGRLVVRKGPLQLRKMTGPDVDRGELQRYLSYLIYCPPILLNNPSLEFTTAGPNTLRVNDRSDSTGAFVELDVGDDGRIVCSRALRPMTVGKESILTPWSASASDPEIYDGIRIPRKLEAAWHPPTGAFTYIQINLETIELVSSM